VALKAMTAIVLLAFAHGAVALGMSTFKDVSCWDDARKITRISVQTDKAPTWTITEYSSPRRVLAVLNNCRLDRKIAAKKGKDSKVHVTYNKGMVTKVETWQTTGSRVCLLVYLKDKCSVKAHTYKDYVFFDFTKPAHLQKKLESPESVRSRKSVLTKMIVLDPGHGGDDSGCTGLYDTREKDIALNICKMVQDYMNASTSFHVYLTREADFYPSLEERVVFANEFADRGGADCFVSVHCNSAKTRSAHGVEIFRLSDSTVSTESYQHLKETTKSFSRQTQNMLTRLRVEDSDRLADELLDQLCGLPGFSRRAKEAKTARFRVLRNLSVPGVLVETGFLSNWSDAKRLNSSSIQRQVAWQICEAIQDYFGIDVPKSRRETELALAAEAVTTRVHVVKSGESLYSIARKFGTTITALQAANGMKGTLLKAGQKLAIPVRSSGMERTHVVKAGDNLYEIARKYGVTVSALRERNKIGSKGIIHPGDKIVVPSSTSRRRESIYVVKAGDSLYGISRKYGVSVNALSARNNIGKKGLIHPGDWLIIPSGSL